MVIQSSFSVVCYRTIIPFFDVFFYDSGYFNISKNADFQGVFELIFVIFAGFKNMFFQHIFQQG